ncbi:DUF3151 family protein [Agromyces seonyuensis]|uniref:DUF3151 family protein n=1 Tax=Agromyces seonyuensis TaxID=2662446 RepID=UPI0013662934
MTAEETPVQTEARLSDEPDVREALDAGGRADVPEVVADHPNSPLAWTELADIADSEGRHVDAYAYATVAADLARDQLAAAGWEPGASVPWSDESNRAYLRALDTQRRAAVSLGLDDRAEAASSELDSADDEAAARIASEFTPTQMIPIIPAADVYQAPDDVEAALAAVETPTEAIALEVAEYEESVEYAAAGEYAEPVEVVDAVEAPVPGDEPFGPAIVVDAEIVDGEPEASVVESDGALPREASFDELVDGPQGGDEADDEFGPAVTRATFTAPNAEKAADYFASHGVSADGSSPDSPEAAADPNDAGAQSAEER